MYNNRNSETQDGKRKRGGIQRVLLSAAVLALSAPTAAMADSRTAIDDVSLEIESEITAGSYGSDVSVEAGDTDRYDVSDFEVLGSGRKWSEGDRPRVKITLEVVDAEEYYFASGSESMFRFSDDDIEYVTSGRDNDNTVMTVTVKLGEVPAEDDSDDDDDDSDDDDSDEDDGSYGSKSDWLNKTGTYETEDKTSSSDSSSDDDDDDDDSDDDDKTSDDDDSESGVSSTASVMAGGGDYGNGPGSSDSSSGSTVTASSSSGSSNRKTVSGTSSGSSSDSGNGTLDSPRAGGSATEGWQTDTYGKWYQYSDGTYPKNQWAQLSGSWYCFDSYGYLRRGWVQSDGKWYYCGEDGSMLVNAKTPDGYYVGGDGVWIQ